jgi:hypothetical protein
VITGDQIRQARKLLGWHRGQVAIRARGIPGNTVGKAEGAFPGKHRMARGSKGAKEAQSEPAWLTKLATIGRQGRPQSRLQARRDGTQVAASEGRRLAMWACTSGWTGGVRDLSAGAGGLACPACGSAGELQGPGSHVLCCPGAGGHPHADRTPQAANHR